MLEASLPNTSDQMVWHLTLIAQRWASVKDISPSARCFGMLHAISLLLEGKKALPRCEIYVGETRVTGAFSEAIEQIMAARIKGEKNPGLPEPE